MLGRMIKRLGRYQYIFKENHNKRCNICLNTVIDRDTKFEGWNNVGTRCDIRGSSLGLMSYMGNGCRLIYSRIGRYCAIASDVKCIYGQHPTGYVSVHDLFYTKDGYNGMSVCDQDLFDEYDYVDEARHYFLSIENDVWIGEGVRILGGIKIGSGAIIAAGTLVTKNVPEYAIVGGVPGKVIRYRFDSDKIDFLLNNPWWEKDLGWIIENAESFIDFEEYRKRC